MLTKFYTCILKVSERKFAPAILCLVAFWESIIFPLPPDLILIPLSLARQKKAFFFAGLATIFSVFGGTVGYLIGYLFWAEIGNPLTIALGYGEAYSSFEILFDNYGILIIIIGALTPFPFKIIAILSGVLGYSLISFVVAAFFSRGLRFYLIAGIIFAWGNKIDSFLKKYLGLLFFGLAIVIIGGYVFFK